MNWKGKKKMAEEMKYVVFLKGIATPRMLVDFGQAQALMEEISISEEGDRLLRSYFRKDGRPPLLVSPVRPKGEECMMLVRDEHHAAFGQGKDPWA